MKEKMSQTKIIVVLTGLLITSLILNFLHMGKVSRLSDDVRELYKQQTRLETVINHLHNLDGEDGYGH